MQEVDDKNLQYFVCYKTYFNVSCWFIKCYTSEACVKRKLSEKKVMSFY